MGMQTKCLYDQVSATANYDKVPLLRFLKCNQTLTIVFVSIATSPDFPLPNSFFLLTYFSLTALHSPLPTAYGLLPTLPASSITASRRASARARSTSTSAQSAVLISGGEAANNPCSAVAFCANCESSCSA